MTPPKLPTPSSTQRVPERLRSRLDLVIPVSVPPEHAIARIQHGIESEESIEGVGGSTDRRVSGTATTDSIRLGVRDVHWPTRRKTWNIQFEGRVVHDGPRTALTGFIEILDHASLRRLMSLFRVASLLPSVFVVGWTLTAGISSPAALWGVVAAIALTTVAIAAVTWMEADGERAAADDARLLAAYIRSKVE